MSQWFSYQALFIILFYDGSHWAFIGNYIESIRKPATAFNPARHRRFSWRDFIETKAMPIAIISFLTAFAYASILSFISVYAETKGLFQYISLFFIVYAAAMLSVRPFTGRLYDRKGPKCCYLSVILILFAAGLFLLSNMQLCFDIITIRKFSSESAMDPFFLVSKRWRFNLHQKHRSGHATSTFFILFDSGMALGAFVLGSVLGTMGLLHVVFARRYDHYLDHIRLLENNW